VDIATLLDQAKAACMARNDAQLAKCLGVTRAALSNWRTGQRFPDWNACRALADKSGLPVAEVLAIVSAARSGESSLQGGEDESDPLQASLPGFKRALVA